jgi:hypothetical protein
MSYVRELTGQWEFSPGLPWKVYRDLPQTTVTSDSAFSIIETRQEIDQDEGLLIRRLAVGIRPRSEQSYEHPQPELAALAQLCRQQAVTVVGAIYSVGEDGPLDTWRYYTTATGDLVCDQAILVWPDGKRAYQAIPRSWLPGQENLSGEFLTLGDSGPVAWPAPIAPDRIIKGSPWQR